MSVQDYLSLGNQKIAIAGAGVTGKAVAQALIARGSEVFFIEDAFSDVDGFTLVNSHKVKAEDFDALMISPGWRDDHHVVTMARTHNKKILNEVDFAWAIKSEISPSQKWLALTGTNGKTTTVEMAAHMLRTAGLNAIACGNVGNTVIEAVLSPEKYDFLILELSSFQLHWMEDAHFSAAAILNIADDHVDWHGSFGAYAEAKLSLLECTPTAILNAQDGEIVTRTQHWLGQKIFFSLDTPAPGEIGLIEEILVDRAFVPDPQEASVISELTEVTPTVPHQVSNALAAAGLALTVGVPHEKIREAIKSFKPGRHRIETIFESDGIRWIDDSKATNPHAAAASILSQEKVIWIAGGLAKGAAMKPLVEKVAKRIKHAIIIGTDKDLIIDAIEKFAPELPFTLIEAPADYQRGGESNSLMEAIVSTAQSIAESGDSILLAPACASMDQFISYADRGDRFTKAVEKLVRNGK